MLRVKVCEARKRRDTFNFLPNETRAPVPNDGATQHRRFRVRLFPAGFGRPSDARTRTGELAGRASTGRYAQDDLRVKLAAHAQLGVANDIDVPRTGERFNRMNFSIGARSPLAHRVPGFHLSQRGVVFSASRDGTVKYHGHEQHRAAARRVRFAWPEGP